MIFHQLSDQNSGTYSYHPADENAREVVIIDYEFDHLVGAKHMSLDELRTHLKDVLVDNPVVVVGQTGRLSALATQLLAYAGVPCVVNLTSGIVAWRSRGLPDSTA